MEIFNVEMLLQMQLLIIQVNLCKNRKKTIFLEMVIDSKVVSLTNHTTKSINSNGIEEIPITN